MSYTPPAGPPPGDFGAPGAPGAPGAATKRGPLNPLDLAMVGVAAVAFIFSFFSFYTAALKSNLDGKALCTAAGGPASACNDPAVQQNIVAQVKSSSQQSSATASAWHGFFGWFGVVLLVIAALIVAVRLFAPQVVAATPDRLATLGLGALGLVMVFIALFVIPGGGDSKVPDKLLDSLVDLGHGFGYWIVLICAVVFVAIAALRFTADGPGGSKDTASSSGYGQPSAQPGGYQQPSAQPGGYQQPSAQPGGYQQPPAQPGGYQQPPAQPGGYQPPPPTTWGDSGAPPTAGQ